MSAGHLKAFVEGSRDDLLWLEYDAYARKVFAGGPEDWYRDPVRYASTLADARRVLPSDVVSVDLTAPFLEGAEADAGAPAEAAKTLLESEAPMAFVKEALSALAHRCASSADVVLAMASPRDILVACGHDADAEPEFDDLDDVTMALTQLVRSLSEAPLAAILVRHAADSAPSDDALEALETLAGAAHHYGWLVALSFENAAELSAPSGDVDLVLAQNVLPADARKSGGGLGAAFWSGGADAPARSGNLRYGTVPAELAPEAVLARVETLKA